MQEIRKHITDYMTKHNLKEVNIKAVYNMGYPEEKNLTIVLNGKE